MALLRRDSSGGGDGICCVPARPSFRRLLWAFLVLLFVGCGAGLTKGACPSIIPQQHSPGSTFAKRTSGWLIFVSSFVSIFIFFLVSAFSCHHEHG